VSTGRALGLGTENMRMAADHFIGHTSRDPGEIENALLLGEPRVENDLEQKIAKFVGQCGEIIAGNGVRYLVGFLDGERRYCRECLRSVPWAAGVGIAKPGHDFEKSV
jgi:hypothetical protein